MAVIGDKYPTLLDISKQFSDDGNPLPLAELLTETNEALDDIPWYEANGIHGHRLSVRSGYPDAIWRKLNAGIPPSDGEFADVTESMGILNSLGVTDRKLAELSANVAQFRLRKNIGHIEAMNQTFMETLIYGDTDVNPEKFLGLAPRFDDITGPTNAGQIIDAGGNDTDLTSIWLVGWGPGSVYGVYPKGTQAGLVHRDMGVELVDDGTGKYFPAYRDWFEWNGGIAVEDWRNVVRIANIDVSELTKDASAGADLIDLMTQAVESLNNDAGLNPVFYAPRAIRSYLRRQITNKSNVWLSTGEIAGRKVTQFDDIPVRRVDKLLTNEARVV